MVEGELVETCEIGDAPDYSTVEIPSKPPTEFTYHERRASLYREICDLGHPSMISQAEAADRYGVSQQQISLDMKRLAESVAAKIHDRDERTFDLAAVVRRSIRGMLENEEYRKASRTAIEYEEWAENAADLQRMQEEIEALKEGDTL